MPQYILKKQPSLKHPLKTVRLLQKAEEANEQMTRSSSLPKINQSYLGHRLQQELEASESARTIEACNLQEKLILKYRHDRPLKALVEKPKDVKDEVGIRVEIAEKLNKNRILAQVASEPLAPPPKQEQYWHESPKPTLAEAQKQVPAGLFRFNPNREDK
eukprot:CAMPEP_0170482306 /NCGR_PEP_ID=MMETSP0208-20121228/2385_1 /TAXON_ID=197538 /ORGANISM="Strombidium inclinatum, Strain S3" /LENGTH=159 /DNA_ID=CAMNT_0010755133 /DNA_START=1561 /DNA_END=2040 /DNA_ORIENTATION=+